MNAPNYAALRTGLRDAAREDRQHPIHGAYLRIHVPSLYLQAAMTTTKKRRKETWNNWVHRCMSIAGDTYWTVRFYEELPERTPSYSRIVGSRVEIIEVHSDGITVDIPVRTERDILEHSEISGQPPPPQWVYHGPGDPACMGYDHTVQASIRGCDPIVS